MLWCVVVTFKVTNETAVQTAVAIKVMTRSMDGAGNEVNEPADKLLLVFPARIVLQPNTSQNVKVQYRKLALKTVIAGEKDGKKGFEVTIGNDGNKHAILSNSARRSNR